MAEDRVVVRSLYLFGEGLLRGILPGGVEELYGAMYAGGPAEAFAAAGDSFRTSGFLDEAAEAYGRCLAASEAAAEPGKGGTAARDLGRIREEARESLAAVESERAAAAGGEAP
jgi:hypothetical protein